MRRLALLASFTVGLIAVLISYLVFGECSGSILEHITCDKIWNSYFIFVGIPTLVTFLVVHFFQKKLESRHVK